MSLTDLLIVIVPLTGLIWLALYSRKYARSIVDFLAAGRIAGRYVLSIGDLAGALSVITLIAGAEQYYQTGFAVSFWGAIGVPVSIFMSLTGYCYYRWRQTRCLSFGQFLELRYGSKFFRVFCAVVRTVAEMVTNSIGPAIAVNFFIFYLGLPHKVMIGGINLPCYVIVVGMCLALALIFVLPSGRISLLITDCVQGILSYPIFVIIVGYIILHFSWGEDIAPVMWNRVPGQSFMDPYDISQLREFNIFALVVTLLGNVLNRAGWIGNDSTGAGKTPHEQKMAGVLGAWRGGFAFMAIMLLAMITIVFMNSPRFASANNRFAVTNTEVRQDVSAKIINDIVPETERRNAVLADIKKIPSNPANNQVWEKPFSQKNNPDTVYFDTVSASLGDTPEGRHQFQQFRSLYNQMLMPVVTSKIFPVGIYGLFCLLAIMLLISTDDSRIFNASATLIQDVILPMFKGHLNQKTHLLLLRLTSVGVAVFFFIVALFFSQLDYINMFTTIMCAVWLGGAAPIMLFGLYSRFGNLVGAWCAIIFGCGTSLAGLILQRSWSKTVYPWLEELGWVAPLDSFLQTVSSPFNPWIVWSMDPVKFPINSFEIYFISMVLSIATYVIGSYLTYKPFNLDWLLHRGFYADKNSPEPPKESWTIRNIFSKIIGITPEYSLGDKIIAYSVFAYAIVYMFVIAFVMVVLWNAVAPWPKHWWTDFFHITLLIVPGIIGVISTVWFFIGGIRDSRRLFADLEKRIEDPDDNGQILNKPE